MHDQNAEFESLHFRMHTYKSAKLIASVLFQEMQINAWIQFDRMSGSLQSKGAWIQVCVCKLLFA